MTDPHPALPNPLECLHVTCSTICNLECRFCASPTSKIPRATMPLSTFTTVVDKGTAFGFRTFNLTPLVGEALADEGLLSKLSYLEQHPRVRDFYFCTNFTLANASFLETLASLTKLRCFSISVYGHDRASFSVLTGAGDAVYRRLLDNLCLLRDQPRLAAQSELRLRTVRGFRLEDHDSELCDGLRRLAQLGSRIRIPRHYQNWGGLIDPLQVTEANLELKLPPPPRRQPCVFLYFKPTVLPDGRLNACSSGDGNAVHIIGDLLKQSFAEIYSTGNPRYRRFLANHRAGIFPTPCRSCTGYRGIDDGWYSYAYHRRPFVSLTDFERWLDGRLDLADEE
jgi:hypothetical protein